MEYRPGCTPVQAVACLKQALAAVERAEHCAVLWFAEVRRRRLFRQLGYSTMNQFAEVELGFSRTRTGDYMRLAAKLDELPALRDSLAAGQVGYSKAREVIKVATPQNEDQWLELAANSSRTQLRQKVRQVQEKARRRRAPKDRSGPGRQPVEGAPLFPAAAVKAALPGPDGGPAPPPPMNTPEIPVRLGVDLWPDQFARFEALLERLQRLGRSTAGSGRGQVLLDGLAALVEAIERGGGRGGEVGAGTGDRATKSEERSSTKRARRRAPVQIHVFQCPECGKASVRTGRGELPLGASTFERLACDAVTSWPAGPGEADSSGPDGDGDGDGKTQEQRRSPRRNKATIPPKIRNAVLARDRHRCQAPGCRHIHHLEVHHIVPRSRGGTNRMDNLITLCSGCHRVWHERGGPPPGWVKAAREQEARPCRDDNHEGGGAIIA